MKNFKEICGYYVREGIIYDSDDYSTIVNDNETPIELIKLIETTRDIYYRRMEKKQIRKELLRLKFIVKELEK